MTTSNLPSSLASKAVPITTDIIPRSAVTFRAGPDTEDVYIRVIDKDTGQVVREIAPEEQRLSKNRLDTFA